MADSAGAVEPYGTPGAQIIELQTIYEYIYCTLSWHDFMIFLETDQYGFNHDIMTNW